jgi:hypothetical protein
MDKSAAFPLLNSIQDGQGNSRTFGIHNTKHALVAPVSADALDEETKIHWQDRVNAMQINHWYISSAINQAKWSH